LLLSYKGDEENCR